MKAVKMRFDRRKPEGVPLNGNAFTGHSDPAAGYLVLDENRRLKRRVVYRHYERARQLSGAGCQVISRKWWERQNGKQILEA